MHDYDDVHEGVCGVYYVAAERGGRFPYVTAERGGRLPWPRTEAGHLLRDCRAGMIGSLT